MAIATAETSKGRKAPKVLSHLEIHPKMGGGHIVKHVYSNYEHPSKEVHFNEDGKGPGGEHIMSHLAKHAGIEEGTETYDHHAESETEDEIKD